MLDGEADALADLSASGSLTVSSEHATEEVIYVPPVKLRYRDKGSAIRRRFEIRGYVGPNGWGKTLCMVQDALPSLDSGRKVLSTVRIIDTETGEDHKNYERLTEWKQLLAVKHATVLFDEILGIASSRSTGSLPPQVLLFLNKLRHADVDLGWTAPNWARADVAIREVTKAVTVCRGYLPKVYRVPGEDRSRQWSSNRLFRFNTYAADDFSTWSDNKEAKLRGKCNTWFWRPGTRAEASYDTLGAVDMIGDPSDAGRCANCGGTRTAMKCTCEDYVNRGKQPVEFGRH